MRVLLTFACILAFASEVHAQQASLAVRSSIVRNATILQGLGFNTPNFGAPPLPPTATQGTIGIGTTMGTTVGTTVGTPTGTVAGTQTGQ